jgi:Tfp pilus assembly protein PilF
MRTLKFSTSVAVAALLAAGCVTTESKVRPVASETWTSGNDSASLYEIGKQHLAAKRFGLAIAHFDRMLAQDPDSIVALNAIAATYDQLGRFDVSEGYYKRAMRQNPNSKQTLNNIGYSYLMQEKFDKAQRYLSMADRVTEPGEENAIVATNRALAESETTPDEARKSLARWENETDAPETTSESDKSRLLAEAITEPATPKSKVRVIRSGERDYTLFTRSTGEIPVEAKPAVWRIPARQETTQVAPTPQTDVSLAALPSEDEAVDSVDLSSLLTYLLPDDAKPEDEAAGVQAPKKAMDAQIAAVQGGNDTPVISAKPAMSVPAAEVTVPQPAPSLDVVDPMPLVAIEDTPKAPTSAPTTKTAKLEPSMPEKASKAQEIVAVSEPMPIGPGPVVPVKEVKVANLAPLPAEPEKPAQEIVRVSEPLPLTPGPAVPVVGVKVANLSPLADAVDTAPQVVARVVEPIRIGPGPAAPLTEVKVAKLTPAAVDTGSMRPGSETTEPVGELPVISAPTEIKVAAISSASTVLSSVEWTVTQIEQSGYSLAALLVPQEAHVEFSIDDYRPEEDRSRDKHGPAAAVAKDSSVTLRRRPVIEVSNGVGRRAMAARVREYLRAYGQNSQRLTNAKSFYHAETVVFFRPGFEERANAVAKLIPGDIATESSSSLGRSDVRLRLGWDLIEFDQQLYFSGLEL